MRTPTTTRPAGAGDPVRDPTRAAALHRLAVAAGAPPGPGIPAAAAVPAAPADTQTPVEPPPSTPPWAVSDLDPDGRRPDRVPPVEADPAAWADPPWWQRVRWAPDRLAGVALVVLVVALGALAVHRLLASVPEAAPVPELPLAAPGETVPEGGGATADPGVSPDPTREAATAPAGDENVVVSVVGLVHRSGLVTVAPGARVDDALTAAGGVLPEGDRDGLNLARRVADGEQILVGLAPGPDGPRGPRSGIVGPGPAGPPGGAAPGAPGGSAAGGTAGGAPASGGLVDLNTADAAALDALPGVGPVTAAAILGWRTANGPFTSVDQLTEVDGIGPATLSRLRPLVTV